MDRQINFCTAEDGILIAYTVTGEGPPLLYEVRWQAAEPAAGA